MKVNKKSRSYNFLIEMLINAVFFAIAAIVCVTLFFEGNKLNNNAIEVSNGTVITRNIVEQLKFGEIDVNDSLTIYYDESWQRSDKGIYELTIKVNEEEHTNAYDVIEYNVELIRSSDKQVLVSMDTVMLEEVVR